jgi:hypothetical protein
MNKNWWENYLHKPWAAIPNPPHSYTCGELGRCVLREQLGIEVPPIFADPRILRQCVHNMEDPTFYDLVPVEGQPREFDIAYAIRATRRDHVGIGAQTVEGLLILHCIRGAGVTLQSPAEMLGTGFRKIEWYRHERLVGETCRI